MNDGRELGGSFQIPGNLAVLRELIKSASNQRTRVYATGSATAPPSIHVDQSRVIVSLAALEPLFEHEAADLIVTASAAHDLDELQEKLGRRGQRLPFEFPHGLGITLGGAVAANIEGFQATLFGPLRDQVLGMSYFDSEGRQTRCGGKVVKNVTGYDLCRLQVGARGRFGILHEITLRLRPLAEAEVTVVVSYANLEEAVRAGLDYRALGPKISGLVVLDGALAKVEALPAADDPRPRLLIRMEGRYPTLEATCQQLAAADIALEILETTAADRLWSDLTRTPWESGFLLDLRLRPSQVGPAAAALRELDLKKGSVLIADVAGGRIQLCEPPEPDPLVVDGRLRELNIPGLVQRFGATAALPLAPDEQLRGDDRFGARRRLQDRLAMALDPHEVFAAGQSFGDHKA